MKCVFLIERMNYYRAFVPLIEECLKHSLRPEVWHNYDPTILSTPKRYLFPKLEAAPEIVQSEKVGKNTFRSQAELIQKLRSDPEIKFVFSQDNSKYLYAVDRAEELKFLPVNIMIPDSYYDLGIFYDQREKQPFLNKRQAFLSYSDYWKNGCQQYFEEYHPVAANFFQKGQNDFWSVGNTENDCLPAIDPEKVRKKFGIPAGKELFLYLGFPFYTHHNKSAWDKAFSGMDLNLRLEGGFFSANKTEKPHKLLLRKLSYLSKIARDPVALKLLLAGHTEKRLFQKIRKFCDRNNLHLVVKPRLKFPVNGVIQKLSHLCVWDDETQQDPPILKELLSITRISASYLSMATLHSAFAGVPTINLRMPAYHYLSTEIFFPYREEEGTPFRFEGSVFDFQTEELIRKIDSMKLEDFKTDPKAHSQYKAKFFSGIHQSSEEILRTLLKNYP